jgi:hypothetical protein
VCGNYQLWKLDISRLRFWRSIEEEEKKTEREGIRNGKKKK